MTQDGKQTINHKNTNKKIVDVAKTVNSRKKFGKFIK